MTTKQVGVVKGIVGAIIISIFLIPLAITLFPMHYLPADEIGARLAFFASWLLLPASCLAISIGMLARFRFFSTLDIDGGGLSNNSGQANILQSVIQNTMEQFVYAATVYLAWAILMPAHWLGALVVATLLFTLGRILFAIGYTHGAPARALGFALTFWVTNIMFLILIVNVITKLL